MLYFLHALAGALFGYLTVAIAYFVHKHFKQNPKKDNKKSCMVIGHPGSGVLHFLEKQPELQEPYSEIRTRERLTQTDHEITGVFSQETPFDTFLLFGSISEAEAKIWQDFLIRLPIKYSHKHPLYHYIPEYHDYIEGTVIKLSRKGDQWLLQKIRQSDHKVIY